jgi:hypothetical protein
MATPVEPRIDEYFRKRLMPVEGVIPQLAGIEMYGNSIPAGSVGAIFLSTSTFSSVTTLTLASQAPSSGRSSTLSLFPKTRLRETRWMSMCSG